MNMELLTQEEKEELDQLKRNDPAKIDVQIDHINVYRSRYYGDALKNNARVIRLTIRHSELNLPEQEEEITLLLHFISNSVSLRRLDVDSIADNYFLEQLLNAVTQSSSVEEVNLRDLLYDYEDNVYAEIPVRVFSNFVAESRTVGKLTLEELSLEENENSEEILTNAFRKNTKLKMMEITMDATMHFVKAITASTSLEDLRCVGCRLTVELFTQLLKSASIQKLTLTDSFDQDLDGAHEEALFDVFRTNKRLENLSLRQLSQRNNTWFCLLAEGIMRNQSLRSLRLNSFFLQDEESIRLLIEMFQRSSIQVLWLDGCETTFMKSLSGVVKSIIELNPLHLKEIKISIQKEEVFDFAELMVPLQQENTFYSLHFDIFYDEQLLNDCIGHIPKLRGLKKLSLAWDSGSLAFVRKAVQQNSCLQEVTIKCKNSQKEQDLIDKFCARNRFFSAWPRCLNETSDVPVCDYVLSAACDCEFKDEIVFYLLKEFWASHEKHVKHYNLGVSKKRKLSAEKPKFH